MAKKEFTFCGKTLEELRKMSLSEFASLLPARQRRSLKRGLTEQQKILLKSLKEKEIVKTHCRDLIVLPEMVDKGVRVHYGNGYFMVKILPEMIGHYLGELSLTRKKVAHHAPGIGATRSSASLSVK